MSFGWSEMFVLGGEPEGRHMVGIAEILVSLGALCTEHRHSTELIEFGGECESFQQLLQAGSAVQLRRGCAVLC